MPTNDSDPMLRRATYHSSFFLLLVTIGALVLVLKGASEDETLKQISKVPKKAQKSSAQQTRTGIIKDMWISNGAERLHHRISCPSSVLLIHPKGNAFECIEEMSDMKCYLQEKIEWDSEIGMPFQQIRYIESPTGTYNYASQLFSAERVYLAIFSMPGNVLQLNPDLNKAFLKGIAEKVALTFLSDGPQFHSEKFKAYILHKTK